MNETKDMSQRASSLTRLRRESPSHDEWEEVVRGIREGRDVTYSHRAPRKGSIRVDLER